MSRGDIRALLPIWRTQLKMLKDIEKKINDLFDMNMDVEDALTALMRAPQMRDYKNEAVPGIYDQWKWFALMLDNADGEIRSSAEMLSATISNLEALIERLG